MRRLAVLGSPIAHSLSPTVQLAAYRELGLDWSYEAIEVMEGGLGTFLQACDSSWQGLSLTMPLKTEAISSCDFIDPLALQVNAVNTITWNESKTRAYNTDVLGFSNALKLHDASKVDSVAILGGGATARSAVAAVSQFASRITVYIRDRGREESLLQAQGNGPSILKIAPWDQAHEAFTAPLVISTTPKAATDCLVESIPLAPGVLFEALYDPWPTSLVAHWRRSGGRVVNGLDLLVEQGIEQLKLFAPKLNLNDTTEIRRVMLTAGRAELDRRKSIA